MDLRFNEKCASEATTWVFVMPSISLPTYGEALDNANSKSIAIGLHKESFSLVVHFPKAEFKENAERKLKVILEKGGASLLQFQSVVALDLYHAEAWGLVSLSAAPVMPQYADEVIEKDDLSDAEQATEELAAEILGEQGPQDPMPADRNAAGLFAVIPTYEPTTIVVPSISEAIDMETSYERQVRKVMESGGPLTPWLEERIYPRNKQHVQDVQDECRALAKKHPVTVIAWITIPPNFITVCVKPTMEMKRRVEWIKFKAAKLEMELTLPVFMALFKQVTNYGDAKNRLSMYKMAVEIWQGPLDWKALDKNVRNLIQNINNGQLNCFCKHCKRVIPVSSSSTSDGESGGKFCSRYCAGQFCTCGKAFEIRQVTDWEKLGIQQNRLGHYETLVELVNMLPFKADAERYKTDLDDEFRKLEDVRRVEGCCQVVNGLPDGYFENEDGKRVKKGLPCVSCKARWMHLIAVQSVVRKISTGMATWGHCEAAAKIMEEMTSMPIPKMDEKFCESCQPARKKVRKV